ncbi:MAG: hypothetical protein ACOY3K_04755 [Candidatus Omnitrophota bacterium]
MSLEKAKNHFLGKDGHVRLNCARAVAEAFRNIFSPEPALLEHLAVSSGGRAPDGYCGAFYAAKRLLGPEDPRLAECEASFVKTAGSVKCREIKALKKLPCVGCVEIAARSLERS